LKYEEGCEFNKFDYRDTGHLNLLSTAANARLARQSRVGADLPARVE
jgi:hypothetical protein